MLALCGLLTAMPPARASAEWQFSPFIGFTFLGSTTIVDPDDAVRLRHWNLGGTVSLVGRGPLGVESVFVYVPGFFERGNSAAVTESRSYALMGNMVLTIPRGWNEYGLRPFVSSGVGLLHAFQKNERDVFPVRQNLFGYNIGGGAVGFLTDRVGLRFDLRYYRNLRPSSEPDVSFGRVRLHYWTGTVGVVFKY